MKKSIALFLVLTMLLSLAACGKQEQSIDLSGKLDKLPPKQEETEPPETPAVTEPEKPEKTEKPLLREYIETNSLSLKDFITFKHRIVASGNFVPSDDNSLYDYVVSGDMRIFDKAVLTTYDYVAVGSIDVSEYEQYYEYMLSKSTIVPSPEISKSR